MRSSWRLVVRKIISYHIKSKLFNLNNKYKNTGKLTLIWSHKFKESNGNVLRSLKAKSSSTKSYNKHCSKNVLFSFYTNRVNDRLFEKGDRDIKKVKDKHE